MEKIEKLLGRKLKPIEKMLYEVQKNRLEYRFDKDKDGNLISIKYERRFTGKLTTDGKKIFEGDIVEAEITGVKYPLFIGGPVKWDEENKKWLNLNFFDDNVPHTLFFKKHIK